MESPFTTQFDLSKLFLDETPRAAFFSALQPFLTSPARRRFFETQFDPVYDWYQGALGQQARQGSLPSLKFADYLMAPQAFGHPTLEQRWSQAPSFQTGMNTAFLNPRTRWLVGF